MAARLTLLGNLNAERNVRGIRQTMADDEDTTGSGGGGKWDVNTNRYIPMGGGSRSKLPLKIKGIRPYQGFTGIDRPEERKLDTVEDLILEMGGGSRISAQDESYLNSVIKKLEEEE